MRNHWCLLLLKSMIPITISGKINYLMVWSRFWTEPLVSSLDYNKCSTHKLWQPTTIHSSLSTISCDTLNIFGCDSILSSPNVHMLRGWSWSFCRSKNSLLEQLELFEQKTDQPLCMSVCHTSYSCTKVWKCTSPLRPLTKHV